ncbi:GSU2403 family nucleotidyltransferase fold protein [Falsirhodobacter halotolerans]|uniref:GSU2403 family nucleotidyltransferase fold protein n=1 Tax=Falsirhodobacter halotolerans TaxID=1146892 RepID=UPI001FD43A16|nr:GSU2403 family nucleotidyltransferase fold protein [Falsirhodobacter halotolerans]MCJ8140917.1 nucleotidyltransferase domain-containing protein [Falsirhodobacter halotolerans]
MGTKMADYNDLDSRILRDRIDLISAYDEWRRVRAASADALQGSMAYERRGGTEYLYRRIKKKGHRISRSLGPRSAKTDAIQAAFQSQKAEAEARLTALTRTMTDLAGVMRALGHVRMPATAARILRKLDEAAASARFRVVGTYALYAYEAHAGVVIQGQHLQTNDMDILVDDRAPLQIVVEGDIAGLETVVQSVDDSFRQRARGDYRLTNKDSFMVEFIRPEPHPIFRPMPGKDTGVEGDVRPAMIDGLEWLVNAPALTTTVIDQRGFPVRMTVPAPAVWAAHKLWVSSRADRDPAKALRDRRQVALMHDLIEGRMPQERLDRLRHSALPKDVAEAYHEAMGGPDAAPPPGIAPDW